MCSDERRRFSGLMHAHFSVVFVVFGDCVRACARVHVCFGGSCARVWVCEGVQRLNLTVPGPRRGILVPRVLVSGGGAAPSSDSCLRSRPERIDLTEVCVQRRSRPRQRGSGGVWLISRARICYHEHFPACKHTPTYAYMQVSKSRSCLLARPT